MQMITRLVAVGAMASLLSSSWLLASEPDVPFPAQIAAAKKVFLANAGSDSDLYPKTSIDKDHLYRSTYLALREWGRFELVSTPGQADLIAEVHIVDEPTPSASGWSVLQIRVNLALRDPTTQTSLWVFTERPKRGSSKDFDAAQQLLVADFKDLVTRALAAQKTAAP